MSITYVCKVSDIYNYNFLILFSFLQGVAFVNGINIGRYWSSGGPQINLYVPATFLVPSPGENTIVMFELEGVSDDLSITFTDKPNIFGPITI